ncbi:MAG: pyruvate dehydrogenase (acetyl-transferring) E1 component subunit alpha [Phycisphaerales bacterium]|nr:pyruvate dehydrogenase (acetyl-transferring) E1 component subunit alpha [Phycisphaerales bacterium]
MAQTAAPAAPSSTSTRRGVSADLPDATLSKWLRDMFLIREFEVRCAQAYQQAKIGGFCHLYIGQEACAVGTIGAVNHDDPIVTAYRDHGHALARGMDPGACMAEMFGKSTGCAKGKGGSMHMFDRPNWLFGGHGIVGAQTALGTGLAFAARYEWEVLGKGVNHPDGRPATLDENAPAKKKVSLCYLGDGALNQGCLHEAMNLAGLYSLPVIFIVENNRYSMGTAIERGTTMAHNLLAKGAAYGIDSLKINEEEGLDILRLYDKFKPFADECRAKQRPGFVDLHTYRYQGHSMSDPQKYRTKEEVEAVKQKDSIDQLVLHLMNERKCMTEAQFLAMQREVKDLVAKAMTFAEESPIPDVDAELYSDVYSNIEANLSPTREYVHGAKNPLL